MTLFKSLFAALAFTTALFSFGGCDEVDEAIDCSMICNRYSDCFDANYDVSACESRCENNADNTAGFDDHADDCENCLDDRSCTGSFACIDECSGIVP